MYLQYVLNFPRAERYVSILKEAQEPEAQTELDAQRARLKALIRRQLAESAMLADADEGLNQEDMHVRFYVAVQLSQCLHAVRSV